MFDPVVLMPVYNHGASALPLVARIRAQGLPCLVIDDGSDEDSHALLATLRNQAGVTLLRLDCNSGKGAAVMAGLHAAQRLGHTHAVQIDADGQHDASLIPQFLALARANPQAVICGTPLYDQSVPLGRVVGRYATHVWVWINTLSLSIRDSMCGFRVYPVAETVRLLDQVALGRRMDFDIEVLVRLHWRGVTIINLPTPVTYPAGSVSHFRLWQDNWLISRLHTRLFFGMLLRAPQLLARKLRST